jgi:hypothetical protein
MSTGILCLLLAAAQDPGTPELRGGWLASDAFDTAAERSSMIAKFKAAHLNTMFVTVPSINGNYGESLPADFSALLDDAEAAGIIVYAWFQCFKRMGESNPADFTSAAEQQAQKQWALDMLAAYPKLDGIHFDYIRYSTWEACNAAKINGVATTCKVTRDAITTLHPGMPLTCAVFNAAAVSYRGWKPAWEGDVPLWFQNWYAADPNNYYVQKANEPGGNSNWLLGPSFTSYQQDPPAWLKAGFADATISMQYTHLDATWQNEAKLWKSFLAFQGVPVSKACIGLGWMAAAPWFEDSAFDAPAMVRFIKYGRTLGIGGFSIFRLGQPGVDDSPLINTLSVDGPDNNFAAPFTKDVASPLSSGGSPPPPPPPSPPPAPPPAPGPPPGGITTATGGSGGGDSGCGLTGLEIVLLLVVLGVGRRRTP